MSKFGIGQPVRRVEDPRFITGRGRYVDDIELPHQCYGVVVMSPHAHARIKHIDTAKAKPPPACWRCSPAPMSRPKARRADAPMPEDMGGPKGFRSCGRSSQPTRCAPSATASRSWWPRPAAGPRRRRTHRDRVRAAAGCDRRRGCGEVGRARHVGRGARTMSSFTLMFGNKEATDAAFADARHVVTLQGREKRRRANPIEPRAAIGDYHPDDDTYTLYTTSQNPHGNRSTVAGVLKMPETKLRVISPDVGGGFGMKQAAIRRMRWCCGHRAASAAVRSNGWRRVGSAARRRHGRDQMVTGEIALDAGRQAPGHARQRAARHGLACRSAPPWWCRCSRCGWRPAFIRFQPSMPVGRAVFTNTVPLGALSGRRPAGGDLSDRATARAAPRGHRRRPDEIRRRNLIPPAKLPLQDATGITYDSGDFIRAHGRVSEIADWQGFAKRSAEPRSTASCAAAASATFWKRPR